MALESCSAEQQLEPPTSEKHKHTLVFSLGGKKRLQTSPEKAFGSKPTITEEDLTSAEGPSQQYWEVLAEKRRAALLESLSENMDLYEQLSSLKKELSTSKQMLQESRNIVEVLTEHGGGTSLEDDSGVVPEVPSDSDDDSL
ncbi:geminin-like [Culex quinquefasciatus]|uniref:geminin-like n=1 Tax=Culex quinquefasciatus TaxID=7176 RepID=UPI0018E30F41|nr:geminin-like [Culex quinquefasciatus]